MFECVESREYKLAGRTIVWSQTVDGVVTYQLSDYGPRLSLEDLRKAATAVLQLCAQDQGGVLAK